MEGLEQFFNDNDRGYPRDPRRMAYAKLRKNVQGMDREQLEAFIKANLMIPHSQYKMALANLIKLMDKQKQTSQLSEVRQFQKIAGLLKEWHPDKEWDETDDEEDDYDTGIPSDEELFGLDEDDYTIPADAQGGDTAEMGNINEEGKGIVIDVPENADYKDFAKAVANQLRDGYGAHNYKPFLQALVAELRPKQDKSNISEGNSKVDHFYNKIIGAIEKAAKRLDDDSAHELHEKLKAFFNRTI